MNRLDRISALLVQLQSRSTLRALDMAGRFGVSVRTIYRDIRTLEEAGVPVCGDAGVGYSLVEGYRLPPLMFTREEALAFLTAEQFIEQLTDAHNSRHFRSGMDKVRAVMRGAERGYLEAVEGSIRIVRSPYTPRPKRSDLLQPILRSVSDRVILAVDYTDVAGAVSRREVEAVGVSFSHPYWYLTAWCHLRGEYRTFRLDRIDNLAATDRRHTIAEHPPLAELVWYDKENDRKTNLKKPKIMKIDSIEIQTLDPIPVIALTHIGDYSGIGAAFGRIAGWAGRNHYWAKAPRMIGVYHSDPATTPPDQRRSSACLEDKGGMEPEAGMERTTVTGGKYLVMSAEVTMPEYGDAWMRIETEVADRGLQYDDRDHYELYVSCTDSTQGEDAPWIVEFRVPVK